MKPPTSHRTPSHRPQELHSLRSCARILGRSPDTIARAVVKLSPRKIKGRAHLYRLGDVLAVVKASRPCTPLRDEKLREEIRKLRIANDRTEAQYVSLPAFRTALQRVIAQAVPLLDARLVVAWPEGVAGMDPPSARAYGKRVVDAVLTDMSALGDELASL